MTDAPGPPPPPESWPGAHGRRSQAPPVPAWPGSTRASRTTVPSGPGASWPGAPTPAPPRSAPPTRRPSPEPERSPDIDDDVPPGGVAGVLFPAVTVLVALGLVGLWIALDDAHRSAQRLTVIAVALVALVALAVSAYRHRTRR